MQNGPLTAFMTGIIGNEVPEFILSIVICFIAIYLFPALWKPKRDFVEKTGTVEPRAAPAETLVPLEVTGKLSHFLDLPSLASLSSTATPQHQQFWHSPEAWAPRAAAIGIVFRKTGAGGGEDLREALRRRLFHVDAAHLQSVHFKSHAIKTSEDRADILNELSRMVQGMTLNDDEALVEGVCDVATRMLQMHDSSDGKAAAAASRFVQAMQHCGRDVFTSAHFDRVELAWESALQLDALMQNAAHRFYSELPSVRAECSGHCSSQAMLDSEYRSMHEADFLAGRRIDKVTRLGRRR